MKKEKDQREEVIKLLDYAENALIILTVDGESADSLIKGSLDDLDHIITLTLMQDEKLFITVLSVVGVVAAQINTGEQKNAQGTIRALRAAMNHAEECLATGLN